MPIQRCHAVVKKNINGEIMQVFAIFMDRDKAFDFAGNANRWYGEDHPLTPLEVCGHDSFFEPRPFPEMG